MDEAQVLRMNADIRKRLTQHSALMRALGALSRFVVEGFLSPAEIKALFADAELTEIPGVFGLLYRHMTALRVEASKWETRARQCEARKQDRTSAQKELPLNAGGSNVR